MDPLIGAGLITAGASLVNTVAGTSASANLNGRNRRWQEHMSQLTYQRQRELTQDQASLQKQGLINAGISPAAMNGYSGGTASISSSGAQSPNQPEYTPFDSSGIVNAVLQSPQYKVLKEQANLVKEQVRAQKLANDELEDKQNAYRNVSKVGYFDDGSTRHYTSDPDFTSAFDDYTKAHGKEPDVFNVPSHLSAEAMSAQSALNRISAEVAESNSNNVRYQLLSAVDSAKLADKDVVQALYKMDSKQFELLGKNIDKIDSEINLAKVSQELTKQQTKESKQRVLNMQADKLLTEANLNNLKNSNLGAMIDSLFGASNFKDGLKSLLKILIVLAGGSLGSAVVGKLGTKAPVHNTYRTTNYVIK